MPSSSFFSGTNPTPTEYENAVDLVAQATAQATAALASQTAAATSAQSAQGYSVSAGTSAGTATSQAASASTSAASASNSATAAASSATSASSSATSATTSATNAATSATNASNSATAAAGSASSASTYATNAANSATAASNSASDAAATLANALTKSDNLNSVADKSTARTNLGVAIGSNVQAWDADLDAIAAISSTSGLLKKTAANTWTLDTTSYHSGTLGLSQGGTGATDAAGARTALGLGTAATAAATSFLQTASNLSDLASASTARTNLGLGSAATLASSAVLQATNNFSDIGNVTTARTNLGLSTVAATGAYSDLSGKPTLGSLAALSTVTLTSNVTGTLPVANGGTGLTSLYAGYIPYGNGTGAFGSSANLYFDGTNLGVGTSTPDTYAGRSSLSINGTSGGILTFQLNGTQQFRLFVGSGSTTVQALTGTLGFSTAAASDMTFATNGSERMRITSGGLVGIGVTSPGAQLDVLASGSNSTLSLKRDGTGSTGGLRFSAYNASSSYTDYVLLLGEPTVTTASSESGNLLFYTRNSGTLGLKATLDAAGNLGLGVTPTSWTTTSSSRALQFGAGALYSYATSELDLLSNAYYNSGWYYQSNGYATDYQQTSGQHRWLIAPTGTAGNTISFTQAMTLDASGNLGIGTTSPGYKLDVYGSGGSGIHITGAGVDSGAYLNSTGSNEFLLSGGANYNSYSGNYLFTAKTSVASGLIMSGGAFRFWTNSGLTAGSAFTNSEVARIDASGNLGIGTSSPAARLHVYSGGSTQAIISSGDTTTTYIRFINTTNNAGYIGYSSDNLVLLTGGTERARIVSSGNLLVGTTSATGRLAVAQTDAGNPGARIYCSSGTFGDNAVMVTADRNTTNASFYFISAYNNTAAAYKFRVADSGNVTNTNNSYGQISDISLKENIVDATPKLNDLMSVKIKNFNFVGDATKQIGVIAQELEEIFPSLVETSPQDGKKSVKYSVFTPIIIKALQELAAKVSALEAKQ